MKSKIEKARVAKAKKKARDIPAAQMDRRAENTADYLVLAAENEQSVCEDSRASPRTKRSAAAICVMLIAARAL